MTYFLLDLVLWGTSFLDPCDSKVSQTSFVGYRGIQNYQIVHAATAVMIPAKPKKTFFDCSARSRGVGIVISILRGFQYLRKILEESRRDKGNNKRDRVEVVKVLP